MKIFNQYSAVWMALLLVLVLGFVLLGRKPTWRKGIALPAVAAGLFWAWLVLHPQPSSQGLSATRVQASIGQGTPVLLEIQSPF